MLRLFDKTNQLVCYPIRINSGLKYSGIRVCCYACWWMSGGGWRGLWIALLTLFIPDKVTNIKMINVKILISCLFKSLQSFFFLFLWQPLTREWVLYCPHHKNKQTELLFNHWVSLNETFFLIPFHVDVCWETVWGEDEPAWSRLGERRRLRWAGLSWACVCVSCHLSKASVIL